MTSFVLSMDQHTAWTDSPWSNVCILAFAWNLLIACPMCGHGFTSVSKIRRPVTGEVFPLVSYQSRMADFEYVCPSAAITGSSNGSLVIGHRIVFPAVSLPVVSIFASHKVACPSMHPEAM